MKNKVIDIRSEEPEVSELNTIEVIYADDCKLIYEKGLSFFTIEDEYQTIDIYTKEIINLIKALSVLKEEI